MVRLFPPQCNLLFSILKTELFTCIEFDHPILNLYFPSYKSETQKLFYSYLNHDLKKRNLIDKIFVFQIYHAEP